MPRFCCSCDNDSFSVVGEVRFHSTPRIFVNLTIVLADWWDAHWLGIAQRREDIRHVVAIFAKSDYIPRARSRMQVTRMALRTKSRWVLGVFY